MKIAVLTKVLKEKNAFKDKNNFIFKNSVFLLLGFIFLSTSETVEILNNKCTAYHNSTIEKGLSRTSKQEKLTINNIQMHNGLSIINSEKRKIIKFLSDTQDMAPSAS